MELKSFARGGLFGLLTLVVEKGVALLLVVALARVLSPADYGRYSFLVAYLTLFQVLADLGTEPILLRRLAAEPGARGRLVAAALGLRATLALVAGVTAVLLVPWADSGEPGLQRRTALAAAALLFSGQPGYRALFRSQLRMDLVLGVAGAASVLVVALVAIAIALGLGIEGVFAAIALANLAGFALAAIEARGLFRFRLAVDPALWSELLREAWPIGANVFVITVGMRVGPLLLMRLRGPVEVGYFSSASRLTDALNLLPDALMLSVFPLFVRFAVARPDELRALAELAAKLLGVVLLAVILALSALAPEVMGGLFRPEFVVAAPALVLLSWSALLAALGNVYAHLLVAVGRQATLFRINCGAALLQIVLQWVLIRSFGLLGAAVAVVATAVASHATLYALPQTRTWVRPCVHAVARPVFLAGLILVLAPVLLGGLAPWGRAAVLLAAFGAALVATGWLGADDVRRLRALLAGQGEGAAAGDEDPEARDNP